MYMYHVTRGRHHGIEEHIQWEGVRSSSRSQLQAKLPLSVPTWGIRAQTQTLCVCLCSVRGTATCTCMITSLALVWTSQDKDKVSCCEWRAKGVTNAVEGDSRARKEGDLALLTFTLTYLLYQGITWWDCDKWFKKLPYEKQNKYPDFSLHTQTHKALERCAEIDNNARQ